MLRASDLRRPSASAARAIQSELALAGSFFLLALAIRIPYLWEIPRFSDELQEVLWSLSIARGEILPLTAVDSYYGPLWSYLLAGLFVAVGPDPFLPRLVAAVLGAAFVVLVYCFARDVAGRSAGLIAGALMLTSPGHIIINSHTARSNSITPLVTTLAIWLVYRSVSDIRWSAKSGTTSKATPRRWLLVPAGLLLGLALQTHISVIALLPGLALYLLWKGRSLLRTPWPYLAGGAALLGYWNMILFNLSSGFWSLRHARSLQEGYSSGRPTDVATYFDNLSALVQSLSRLLSGTIDSPDNPVRFVYLGLAMLGLGLIGRRSGALLPLAALSIILVLPYFNPRYGPILSGRYLIPLLPVGFAAIAVLIVTAGRTSFRLIDVSRPQFREAGALWIASALLCFYPLVPLVRYYQEAVNDGRTNAPLFLIVDSLIASRQPGERVWLDEGLAQEALGAGGTDLKSYRMLIEAHRVIPDVIKVSDAEDLFRQDANSALLIMESKKRSGLDRSLRSQQLSSEVESASGSGHRYAVYRLTLR